eukprot:47373-Prymnesium_polylepis.2
MVAPDERRRAACTIRLATREAGAARCPHATGRRPSRLGRGCSGPRCSTPSRCPSRRQSPAPTSGRRPRPAATRSAGQARRRSPASRMHTSRRMWLACGAETWSGSSSWAFAARAYRWSCRPPARPCLTARPPAPREERARSIRTPRRGSSGRPGRRASVGQAAAGRRPTPRGCAWPASRLLSPRGR